MTKHDHDRLILSSLNMGRYDAPYTTVKQSEQWSGEGSEYSEWYLLESDPPLEGYEIVSHRFYLAGDRNCGEYAECEPVEQTPEDVVYRFRMQGHNDALEISEFTVEFSGDDDTMEMSVHIETAGKKATSTGILITTYGAV